MNRIPSTHADNLDTSAASNPDLPMTNGESFSSRPKPRYFRTRKFAAARAAP